MYQYIFFSIKIKLHCTCIPKYMVVALPLYSTIYTELLA